MFKKLALLMVMMLLFTTAIIPVYAEGNSSTRLIVMFDSDMGVRNAMEKLSDNAVEHFPYEHIQGLVVHANSRALEAIIGTEGIVNIEEDQIVWANPKPDKPPKGGGGEEVEPNQVVDWGVLAVKADNVWSRVDGAGSKVAVIDTGISLRHSDLIVAGGANFTRAKSYDDDNGHGTHVAGTIAALDNEIGVKGVAYGAELYAVKVLDRRGSGYLSDVVAGIDWSIGNGMDVINMSLGADSESYALEQALIAAENAGLIAVAAAGNDASDVDFPGAYRETIGVGAVDSDNMLAYFSSFGSEVDVVAPGVNIYSTYKGEDYRSLNGTSMATPHIAGLAALFVQENRDRGVEVDLEDFRDALIQGSFDLGDSGYDIYYGYGLPQAQSVIFGEALE